MKKRVAVLMLAALMTVLALAGCGGKKSSDPVVGEWKMTKVEAMGVSMSVEEYLQAAGMGDMKMEMSIKDNGKFSMDVVGESGDGTWKYKDPVLTLTADGESVEAEYKDGTITMEMSGVAMIFEKK
ncbi:MAG: lipocalin family protein [Lachnospiraceae bacterium]|nr:lipocalin family protein [Lachnospiraceae bacterium]